MTTTFIIDNLKCEGCAGSIRKALSSFSQINSVKVDLEQNSVTVDCEDTFPHEKIREKLASLGYPEQGTSTGINKLVAGARSYVSCAIGKLTNED